MGRGLADGVYEHVVSHELARALADTTATTAEAPLERADAHVVLARHLGRAVEHALAELTGDDRAEQARALIERMLAALAAAVDDELAAFVREQIPLPPPRQLRAVYRGAPPERPQSPLAVSTLLTRKRGEPALGHELARELAIADRVDAIVAFVTVGGVRAISDALAGLARRGGRLRVLTTTFARATELAAVEQLARLPGAEVRISFVTDRTRLHAKAWLFHRGSGLSTAYIGSANLTHTALGAGHEWMMKACAPDLPHVIDTFAGTFETLWADAEFEPFDPDDLEARRRLIAALRAPEHDAPIPVLLALRPYPFQVELLDRLAAERAVHGRARNLVVAATGTGKTVVAALDYARQIPAGGVAPRLLFLAHRRELLDQARATFRHALADAAFGELWVGGHEPTQFEHVFASIQTAAAAGLLERFGPAHFEHVIVDECHHVPAPSYQALVPALRPRVLVGLTATPERTDGRSLLADFDGHIGAELRLWHALERELLVPFEYYGIADDVDLRQVRWARGSYAEAELAALYTGNEARVSKIVAELRRRVGELRRLRALGFCVNVDHAVYMAARFSAAGIPACAVHGGTPEHERARAPQRLRDGEIHVVFTCDLYNEGVDLPYVETLLFLRPTASATLFQQQLGRGLRHAPGKTSCLVLDFIGQHRAEFRFDAIYAALTGVPRGRLRAAVEAGFPYLPSGCAVQLDRVARAQVLASLAEATAGRARLVAELRALVERGGAPTLAGFLTATGYDLEDVYRAGGWTPLLRAAAGAADGDATDDDLSRRLGRLVHVDEPARLRAYRDLIAAARAGRATGLGARERGWLHMLAFQLWHRGELRTAEDTVRELAGRPAIARELEELRAVLEERVAWSSQRYPVDGWPLALHRRYSRREIVAGVGHVRPGDKGKVPQRGILKLADQRELLFVTLDKSGTQFSPTTRYRDYAISPERFHWETPATATPTGAARRYLEPDAGWAFYLFVRERPEDAYAFVGRVRYERHAGERPIAITWRLDEPLPAALFDRFATLRPG